MTAGSFRLHEPGRRLNIAGRHTTATDAHTMDPDRYLARIDVDPDGLSPDLDSLARLQRAHVTTVPFETLSITGHPFGDAGGEGVDLTLPALYDKLVDRERGGFCYELNEAFRWLLTELGYAVERRSARVFMDGEPGLPADHLALVVRLDRPYLVDVGLGAPKIRRPIPLDGSPVTDGVGRSWRLVASDRPDADSVLQVQAVDSEAWTDRYDYRDVDRDLSFFAATCEYHQTAPASPFTGDPTVLLATDDGTKRLTPTTLSWKVDGEVTEEAVDPDEWDAVLEREFGLRFPAE